MPVQYTSIVEEHQAVRNNVGIFDISHMGQLIVDGAGAREWLNTMLTNNIDKLDVGTGQYTFLLNERGGIIDDLIVYRIGEQKFLLVVNAARSRRRFRLAARPSSGCKRSSTHESQRGFWRSRDSRSADRRAISRAVRQRCRSSVAKFDCRFSIRWNDCLGRAHRLHGRGRD